MRREHRERSASFALPCLTPWRFITACGSRLVKEGGRGAPVQTLEADALLDGAGAGERERVIHDLLQACRA